jgi:hypothetical protein
MGLGHVHSCEFAGGVQDISLFLDKLSDIRRLILLLR